MRLLYWHYLYDMLANLFLTRQLHGELTIETFPFQCFILFSMCLLFEMFYYWGYDKHERIV